MPIENTASGKVLQKAGLKVVDSVLRFSQLLKAPDEYICFATIDSSLFIE